MSVEMQEKVNAILSAIDEAKKVAVKNGEKFDLYIRDTGFSFYGNREVFEKDVGWEPSIWEETDGGFWASSSDFC